MDGATKNGRLIRFSTFELDRESGELFKQGRKVKLQGQPFELLVALLERPGELLTREELRQKLWATETVGDFDHGLSRAINKVREALGDSPDTPRFVETLPRRGYRFIGAIQTNAVMDPPVTEAATRDAGLPARSGPKPGESKERGKHWIPITVAAAIVIAGAAIWFASHRASERGPIQIQQLTTNSSENPVQQAAISPEGKYLAYGDRGGIEIKLISTGESHLIPRPQGVSEGDIWAPVAWFPDQTRLLASSVQAKTNGAMVTAWSVSVIGGSAVPIRQDALAESISPDGSLIAFTIGRGPDWAYVTDFENDFTPRPEIWVMGARGENARRIVASDDSAAFGPVRWSPDGRRLAYLKMRSLSEMSVDYTIESCDLNGGTRSIIFSGPRQGHTAGSFSVANVSDFAWLSDNRVVFPVRENTPNSRDSNLWQIDVDPSSGKPRGKPQRIASLAGLNVQRLTTAADGRRVAFESNTYESHVYLAKLNPEGEITNPRRLTLDERYDFAWSWTPDSKAVILTSDRTGTFALYKQAPDGEIAELFPTGTESLGEVRASPDRAWLIYTALSNVKSPDQSESVRVMRVRLTGGAPELLFERKSPLDFSCPNRPGTQCIAIEWDRHAHQQIFISFDPGTGARRELFRINDAKCFNAIVSPDGSRMAAVRGNDLEILKLSGQIEKKIELGDWGNACGVDWAANGKAVFIPSCRRLGRRSGVTLLRVDLDGSVKPIWESGSADSAVGIASPDGKYLAIDVGSRERNAWMIENF
jgi:DNA-binding winged helix-turn-helix (wHTH) protein/Tol biopolymer transport system component